MCVWGDKLFCKILLFSYDLYSSHTCKYDLDYGLQNVLDTIDRFGTISVSWYMERPGSSFVCV